MFKPPQPLAGSKTKEPTEFKSPSEVVTAPNSNQSTMKVFHEEQAVNKISKVSDSPSDGVSNAPSDEFNDETEESTVILKSSWKSQAISMENVLKSEQPVPTSAQGE